MENEKRALLMTDMDACYAYDGSASQMSKEDIVNQMMSLQNEEDSYPGHEAEYDEFNKLKESIASKGYVVINNFPLKGIDVVKAINQKDVSIYMLSVALQYLNNVEAVFFNVGWKNSKICKLLNDTAREFAIDRYELDSRGDWIKFFD